MGSTTLSSREFIQDTEGARKAAYRGPVIITDGGQPAHVLLSISEYARLAEGSEKSVAAETKPLRGRRFLEALGMPGGEDIDFDPPRWELELRAADFE